MANKHTRRYSTSFTTKKRLKLVPFFLSERQRVDGSQGGVVSIDTYNTGERNENPKTSCAKMGTVKGRKSMPLREAEGIKKRWQEYTEELYRKGLNDPDNHDGVVTHLEPEILECEVQWASLQTKLWR